MTSTRDRIFLDTNVIVYAFDDSEKQKKRRAIELLESGADFVVSTQVLAETYWVTTRKISNPLDEKTAFATVRRLAELQVVLVDTQLILSAIERSRRSRLALWDAMIVQAAVESGCRLLMSEDLQAGRRYGSTLVENPFG